MLADACPEGMTAAVGAPLAASDGSGLYNCAVLLTHGRVLGAAAKTFLPNYNEFYERRWFRSAADLKDGVTVTIGGQTLPLCRHQVFESADGVRLGIELCEDLWTPLPPSTLMSMAGAEVILNLSASNELISKRDYRCQLVSQQSARCLCGYVYVSAGTGESTSDLVFSGQAMLANCGSLLRQTGDYISDDVLLVDDIDLERIRADRTESVSFGDTAALYGLPCPRISLPVTLQLPDTSKPMLRVNRHPFVPSGREARQLRCAHIFDMQSAALARRLKITGGKLTVGISGGLDSTLALLVACRAMDRLDLPRTNILGITMPCFGTTDRTLRNAHLLMEALGVQQREICIHASVRQHLADIGHDEADHNVVYENAQARERTQVLMDVANEIGGIVLGTGDLSEIALGWCTYNADHMSMYGVNSGVPKTLVRWIVQTVSEDSAFEQARATLEDILNTPISPELLPPDEKGQILQQTEDIVGPYALHDFFLYYVVRFGYEPARIYELCCIAFEGVFDRATILKWLRSFYRRFWTQQFKRNCIPDGVKIGSIALSPRGDWRMPSDASSAAWLKQCDELQA